MKTNVILTGYTDGHSPDILLAAVDGQGRFEVLDRYRQGDNPSFVCISDNTVFTLSETEDRDWIYAYEIKNNRIVPIKKRIQAPGKGLCHLASGDGCLYGSCYASGDFFAVNTELTKVLWHRKPAITGKSHGHWSCVRGGILYLADLGADAIFREALSGGIPQKEYDPVWQPGGSGPRQIVPLGEDTMVTIHEMNNTVLLWKKKKEEWKEVCRIRPTGKAGENYPGGAALMNESYMVSANRGVNTVGVLKIEGEQIRLSGEYPTGDWPRHLAAISGSLILAACQREGKVISCRFADGKLEFLEELKLAGAACAAEVPSPDQS